jgi:DNA-binding MarR family transcriptional regulator
MGAEELRPLGLKPVEYGVLAVLAQRSPRTQTEIARLLGLDRTTILSLAASLERKGLVLRKRDPHDRRAYAVALTLEGESTRQRALELLIGCEEQFLMPLSGPERSDLHELLGRVIEF